MRASFRLYFTLITAAAIFLLQTGTATVEQNPTLFNQTVIRIGPESVVWIVQFSDLHCSIHHPERCAEFAVKVGPVLQVINPSLVFLTGDLTDGKSKDLLVMKQIEDEWIQYSHVIAQVAKTSHLSEKLFYDLRGNHDSFAVPEPYGYSDFYSRYSTTAKFGRTEGIQTVTIETEERRHLFVGVDTAMRKGVRGPTNLFGHPTDDLLRRLDSSLLQWDDREKPVTKVALGHFPVSFTASGKKLKEVLLRGKVSVYLCGHLHTKFGRNLKRLHRESPVVVQVSMNLKTIKNCSFDVLPVEEFWEWEMGDWRRSRAMRILAIDKGHVSFLDIDLKENLLLKPLVMVTFPVDSRFMATTASFLRYECQRIVPTSHDSIRAVVFSRSAVESVTARVFDLKTGGFVTVLDTPMEKLRGYAARGNVYEAKWNYKAFEDVDPLKFWVQIEVVDERGESSVSELRPFSVNGISANTLWTLKEFLVMGCQWADLYYPILWCFICVPLVILLIPLCLSTYEGNGISFLRTSRWVLNEMSRLVVPYYGMIAYLLHLVLFPLFSGRVYSEKEERAYMTYAGWAIRGNEGNQYVGSPDVMVIVLPHLIFVVVPSILVVGGLAVERRFHARSKRDKCRTGKRWMRKVVLIACLWIGWRHFQSCRQMMKAYEMNPILHFPVYSFALPALVAVAVYNTRGSGKTALQFARPYFHSNLPSAGGKRSL